MPDQPQYVLITSQAGTVIPYGPSDDPKALEGAGKLLSAGASPPMFFHVLELQPAKWDDA